jgi:hypothetical protein
MDSKPVFLHLMRVHLIIVLLGGATRGFRCNPFDTREANMAKRKSASRDLYAEVQQSACDKLLSSVTYPFTVFEHREEFPGCSRLAAQADGPYHEYSKAEMKALLRKSVRDISRAKDESVYGDLYSFAGSIVEQAKKVLDAAESAGRDYEGPPKAEMRAIVEGGIENLVD